MEKYEFTVLDKTLQLSYELNEPSMTERPQEFKRQLSRGICQGPLSRHLHRHLDL